MKQLVASLLLTLGLLLVAAPALAVTGTPAGGGLNCEPGFKEQNGLCLPDNPNAGGGGVASTESLPQLITKVINILLTLAGVIAVLFIVVGGFQYITAGGNVEQAEKGRQALTNAIIGLVLVLLSFTIVYVISGALTKGTVF